MAKSRDYLRLFATLLVIVTTTRPVISIDTATIPVDKSQLNMWFEENVKPIGARQGQLDRVLAAAESQPPRVIKVSKDGSSGQFRTITEAVKSIPDGNKQRVIVSIGPGVYHEKIKIPRTKPFVTFYGQINGGSILPNLTYDGTAAKYGTVESATLIVESDYFMVVNLNIVNSAPKPTQNTKMPQALAMRIMGNRAAFYNCRFFGFQDTLMDDRGYHFFKNCYVEGTVDFIFGKGTSLYLDSELHVIGDGGYRVIAAQDRSQEAEKNGYSFVHCKITGSGTGTYLGRAWRSHAKVVYSYTYMSSVVHPDGWNLRNNPKLEKTVFYGEYKCFGPGSGQAQRVDYAEDIDDKEAVGFLTLGYVRGSQWLLPPPRI